MTDTTTSHFSIGDLLGLLHDEFPDITISKIRFLESQGLVDPERTPSGYRKFYEADVERLRWILREQKENFLPLKVIKTRLEQLELGGGLLGAETEPKEPEPSRASKSPRVAKTTKTTKGARRAKAAKGSAKPKTAKVAKRAKVAEGPGEEATSRSTKSPSPRRAKVSGPPVLPPDDGRADNLVTDPGGASLTRDELAQAAGISDAELADLEDYGLVSPTEVGGRVLFDEDALAVARLAAGFAKHGIDARHLRMYRSFAQREAVLYQQTLLAVLRQRNPEARARAREQLADLAKLGRGLRTAFLRQAAGELLGE